MTQNDYEHLKGMINFAISEICYQVLAGSNLDDLITENKGLIFNWRDDMYTPRRHRIEVFYNYQSTPYKVCAWEQFGDYPNDKQRADIVKQIRAYTI